MTQEARGGVIAAPTPMPPIAMPIPSPRCAGGIQSATARLKFGRATASANAEEKPHDDQRTDRPDHGGQRRVAATAVKAVKKDHQTSAAASTTRAPQRSPSHPPGIWQSA